MGEYLFEEFARLPVEVEYASELRYRNPPMTSQTLLMALTQSGETIDTLAALREMKRKGHRSLALCNVVGSSIARESDGGVYLHAGPEIRRRLGPRRSPRSAWCSRCSPCTSAACAT